MYMSCIELDLSHRETLETVVSPYRTHAAIEGAFGLEAIREDSTCRILWRIDDAKASNFARLYIVSPEAPGVLLLQRITLLLPIGLSRGMFGVFVSRRIPCGVCLSTKAEGPTLELSVRSRVM